MESMEIRLPDDQFALLVANITEAVSSSSGPEWFTLAGAAAWSGLSERTIQKLISDNLIVSSNVVRPGNTRGRRLVKRKSLNDYIEDCGSGKADPETLYAPAVRKPRVLSRRKRKPAP